VRRSLAVFIATFAVIVVGSLSGAAHARPASPTVRVASCTGAVGWQNARRMIGRVATIRGDVVGTRYARHSAGSPTFLNIGVNYPNSRRVTVVIWQENRSRFGRPESRYLRRTICVRGFVDTYAGAPDIEATSPTQIAIAG